MTPFAKYVFLLASLTHSAAKRPTRQAVCIRRDHRPWSDDERYALREMREDGIKPTAIAKALNRSVAAVKSQLQLR